MGYGIEVMSLIGDTLSAIKFAVDILTKQDPRRKEVADLIQHIAETIEVIVDEYTSGKGINPSKFSEFSYYCAEFGMMAESVLSPETQSRIRLLLSYTLLTDRNGYKGTEGYKAFKRDQSLTGQSPIAVFFGKLTGPSISSNDIKKILEIAGELRGIANLMKVSKRKV